MYVEMESRLKDFKATRANDAPVDRVLLLDPAVAFWLAMTGADEELRETRAALRLEERDLVLCPVNDGSDAADSGSHWSLLVLRRRGAAFEAVHYDSAEGFSRRSLRQAGRVARCLGAVELRSGLCAQQENGYDCGVYVLLFSELILAAHLGGRGRGHSAWEARLAKVQPQDVSGHRAACRRAILRRAELNAEADGPAKAQL